MLLLRSSEYCPTLVTVYKERSSAGYLRCLSTVRTGFKVIFKGNFINFRNQSEKKAVCEMKLWKVFTCGGSFCIV